MTLIKNNYFRVQPTCSDADAIALFAKTEFSEANLTAWLSAIGKTYLEVKNATCKHFTYLKANGLWKKGANDAYYLPIGNTASQRKFNVYNPLDTNAAFRLSFNGGITYTNFAIKGNGVNGWIDTFWNTTSNASGTAVAFALDSEDDIQTGTQVIGSFGGSNARMWVNIGQPTTGNIQIADVATVALTGTRKGLFFSRRVGTLNQSYREATSLGSVTAAYTPNSFNFYMSAVNSLGNPTFYAPHGQRMLLLSGGSYSEAEYLLFRTSYNEFKTDLGIV